MNKVYQLRCLYSFLLLLLGFSGRANIYVFHNTYTLQTGVSSPAKGTIVGTYNDVTNTISYSIVFSGLVAPTTVAHFHGPATASESAGVQLAHTGFPVGVTSGFYSNTQTLTAPQEIQLLSGLWYSNIHSSTYPAGEIRAQILLTDIMAPSISNIAVDPSRLWPANHKLRDISVSYTSNDNFPAPVTCSLSVSSDEPVTSASDHTSPDWMVVSSQRVQLRAERMGKGDGRTYTVTVTCTDAQGNSSSRTATVLVPHDNSNKAVTRATSAEPEVMGVQFRVAPNPTKSTFRISIRTDNPLEKVQLRLFDISGRLVESRNVVSGDVEMGSTARPGTYLLKMIRGSETQQLRLVKLD